jgi:NAD(P)-dependent dehydrogenase (short-subunit alcohol dehydrogenase family)
MRFQNKVAIVTGAGNGIGKATSLMLAREGAKVVAIDIDQNNVEQVATIIRDAGGTALPLIVDITNVQQIQAATAQVIDQLGQIDILVNNAGAGWKGKAVTFADTPVGSWEWIIDLNVKGTLHFTQAVLNHMVKRKYGKIINVTSIAASAGIPKLSVYSASKGALVSFTKSLAMELGPSRINVNCVSPGVVAREDEAIEPYNGTFLGRKGRPDEYACVIAFLASDDAAFITGVDYLVDGGRTLGPRGV